jgi:hypothetical protein
VEWSAISSFSKDLGIEDEAALLLSRFV